VSTPAVAAPFLAASLALVAAGGAKLWRPDDTARALRVAGLPSHRRMVRAGAAAELAVGVAAIAVPSRWTGALVAAAYAGFSVFVAIALVRKWPLSSCGCFGRPDARPGYPHLALNLGALVAAGWWAAVTPARTATLFDHSPIRHTPWHGLPLALITVVIAGLAYLVWTNPVARSRTPT
jgi:hypothetical protein